MSQQTAIAGSTGVACFKCDVPRSREDYILHIRPFGAYADPPLSTASPNLTCTIKLMLSSNNVSYSSVTGLFTSELLEWDQSSSSRVPNETAGSVYQLFSLVPNSWVSLPRQFFVLSSVERECYGLPFTSRYSTGFVSHAHFRLS